MGYSSSALLSILGIPVLPPSGNSSSRLQDAWEVLTGLERCLFSPTIRRQGVPLVLSNRSRSRFACDQIPIDCVTVLLSDA